MDYKLTQENLAEIQKAINEEADKHDLLEDITEEQMETVPKELVAEEDQDVIIGSRVGEMPDVMKLKESGNDILEIIDGHIENEDSLKSIAINGAEERLGLNEDEAAAFAEAVLKYRAGEKFNYYDALPKKMQFMVDNLAAGVQMSTKAERNFIASQLFNEFINDQELEQVFVDFDKSIKTAIKIPSAEDMYSESNRDTLVSKLQEIADTIRDEDPEKADTLIGIKDAYIDSISMQRLIDAFNNSGRVRKAVRRDVDKAGRYLEEYNFRNQKSIFKMSDVSIVPLALKKIFIDDKKMFIFVEDVEKENIEQDFSDLDITETDINKFIILFCKSAENLDPHNIVDASYMYYAMKNIITLIHTDETKTSFTGELINNIINVIKLIREKEEEYNGIDLSKSSRRRKVSSSK